MNRRGFLAGIIASCAAPAIIRTPGLIMPIKPTSLWGDSFYTTAGIAELNRRANAHMRGIIDSLEIRWARDIALYKGRFDIIYTQGEPAPMPPRKEDTRAFSSLPLVRA